MSITMSILSAFPDGAVETEGAVEQRQIGVAWVREFATPEAPTMQAAAERHQGLEAGPIDVEPQVYCRTRVATHATNGLSPCSDLGCTGCALRDGVLP